MNLKTKNIVGALETKYRFKEFGVRFSEKWNTDNVLSTEIAMEDLCEGVKMFCETSFAPRGSRPTDSSRTNASEKWTYGDKKIRLKGEFKNRFSALNIESDFKAGGPMMRGGLVLGFGGWVVGCSAGYDLATKATSDAKIGMGFIAKEFILSTSVDNGKLFTGSVHHAVNEKLETGLQVSWTMEPNSSAFAIGCRYAVSPETVLRLKLDHQPLFSFGYSLKLKEGVTLYLSTQLNGKDFRYGEHNVGVCVELEA